MEVVSFRSTTMSQRSSAFFSLGGAGVLSFAPYVFRLLVTRFREMGRSPINYFKFVLDSVCFGTSIENMFHISFLVKEGKVEISVCKEMGLPLVNTDMHGSEFKCH